MENPSKMGWFRGQTHYFRKHPFGELTSFPILRSKKSKVQASAVLLCHVADVYLPPVFLLMAKKDGNSRLIYILRFQPPLKHWVFSYNHHWLPKGFNHRNWGKSIILMVVEAQGIYIYIIIYIAQVPNGEIIMFPCIPGFAIISWNNPKKLEKPCMHQGTNATLSIFRR